MATKSAARRVEVRLGDEVIADSANAVEMEESGRPNVFYIPRADARMDRLVKTSHTTYCPFKGDASYFSVKGGPENAVWSYETPYDELPEIREYLAFYPEHFRIKPM
ncbi:MAG: DUF427 domain-containing protein [Betaproteobacteria bacterium]